jgi:hypothetical protein
MRRPLSSSAVWRRYKNFAFWLELGGFVADIRACTATPSPTIFRAGAPGQSYSQEHEEDNMP